ncbi:gephyrin-like molybdotransferase Glp [Xanthomonas theicola]|uniref:Molybdopterin molybdenumtransferase n=1 Tax=Xanthomonas theicola TaxID=56464 RepID=A0A2S6ZG40_9XANT|nr:gephyrin-like molybdotransferase Glp [Xanthomonas theicola]PPT91247.1 molybdopterin molybdenumtransferase MoeA [Xanthomonas theicola]QNH24721.1 molybdopterin molybdotransferase MoeA [Xanthomonas theicola]
MNHYPSLIAYSEALAIVAAVARSRPLPAERLTLPRADGRVLLEALDAPIDLPSFANSAMDGFALRHADLTADAPSLLCLAGEQFAGVDRQQAIGAGECLRVTTGAPLPAGADTVLVKENAVERDGRVQVPAGLAAGAHVRGRGEDVRTGARVLEAGLALTPSRIGLAAALGVAQLAVAARPTVAVFATGDELVEPGMPLQPGQIYNSNRDMLMAQLRLLGLEPTAWPTLPDDPQRIRSMLGDAASAFDVVLTCGGVSAGEKDYLPRLLAERGRIHFWKVRMRPGMPLLFGELERALFLGLPGNPVSVLATFMAIGRPLLDALQQRAEPRPQWRARLASGWDKRHDRLEFLRGRMRCDAHGQLWVEPNPADGSHRLRGAADSDVLLRLDEGARRFDAGEVVEIVAY